VACLVESGYSGATTLQIQARAGVSRGRLLHHFPSRDELLVAASRHLATERLRATAARIGGLARPHRRRSARPRGRADVGDVLRAALLGGDRAVDGGPHQPRAATGPAAARPRTDPHLSLWKALARTLLE